MGSFDRRDFFRIAAGAGVAALVPISSSPVPRNPSHFPPPRERLLDEVESRAANYFLDHADAGTGLVLDRARMEGRETRRVASLAATGFGLSALTIADRRGYLPGVAIRDQVENTLEFLVERSSHRNGFFPHFVDVQTGARVWRSEFSSIDTAWLLCGALHSAAHFQTRRISALAQELYERVDWKWMLNSGDTLSHGWTPEKGFLPYRWDSYSELLAMYVLALGSASNPIPRSCWDAWRRPVRDFNGFTYIETDAPLFAHQYSHAWFDFRGRRDRYADYFENSRMATGAHRLFCLSLARKFPWYGEDMWGITASDSRRGYLAWGGPLRTGGVDGTLVPCAAAGSLPFMPEECGAVLETMLSRYGNRVWGRYGFVDAFHPQAKWYDTDVVAIDQGITMLMAENARSGMIWDAMFGVPGIERGMDLAGLRKI